MGWTQSCPRAWQRPQDAEANVNRTGRRVHYPVSSDRLRFRGTAVGPICGASLGAGSEIMGERYRVVSVDVGQVAFIADREVDHVVSVMVGEACVVRVPDHLSRATQEVFGSLNAREAFAAEPLRLLVQDRGAVVGLSWHHYGDQQSLRSRTDPDVVQVSGNDAELLSFLASGSIEDWAESGFSRDPSVSEPSDVEYWLLLEQDRVTAAGNMTSWRGTPSDVGVLVTEADRGKGLAGRLVGAMLADTLPKVDVIRYRALSSNAASLAVADRLGFSRYGGNYLARLTPG